MFAFRDNAFQPKLASVMKHDRAVLLDVFVQSDARPRRAIPGPFVFGRHDGYEHECFWVP